MSDVAPAEPAPSPRSRQGKLWGALALVVLVRLLTLWPAVIDDDEAFFAASANALHGPTSFFRAALDDKPPGTVLFDEAVRWIAGPWHLPQWSRFAGLFVLALTGWLLARIATRLAERERTTAPVQAGTALAFALATGAFSPKLFALTNEQLMLLPIVAAVWLALEPRAGPRPLRAVWAGVALGAAACVKQTALVFLLPVVLATDGVGMAALVLVAFALTAMAGAWSVGLHDYWTWTFVYPREALMAARRTLFSGASDGLQNAVLFAVALAPLLVKATRGARSLRDGRGRRLIGGWLLAAALAIGAGSGLFTHYFLLAVPPVALLCGLELGRAPLSRRGMAWVSAAYVGCAIAAALPLTNLFWGNDLPYFGRVAERVRALTRPDDAVFLWGGSPVPLALSGRRNATRFVTSRFVVEPYATPETLRLFRDDLERAPPPLILDLHARGDDRQNLPPEVLPWLGDLLARRYRVWADPALPWARFYVRDDRAPGDPPRGFCASAALRDADDAYPHAMVALKPELARLRTGLRPQDPRRTDSALRAAFGLDLLHTTCRAPPPTGAARSAPPGITSALPADVEARFAQAHYAPPLPLDSPYWWVELAIVEMQPVIRPRAHRAL